MWPLAPALPLGSGQLGAIQSVAPSFGVELRPVGVHDADEIERTVAAFARASNGGLIVTVSPRAIRHRDLIVTLAAKHRLPAVYPYRFFATGGGLISYGPDTTWHGREWRGRSKEPCRWSGFSEAHPPPASRLLSMPSRRA